VSEWERLGVQRLNGNWSSSERSLQPQLFLPAGAQGPALLLHHNFGVIRRYNNSDRYALVVALLARAFDGGSSRLETAWPTQIGSLNREQVLELQTLLNGLGFDSGTPDGLFGSGTRRAVRGFQAANNLPADGFPTASLLNEVRARSGVAVEPAREPRGLQRTGIRDLQRLLNRLGYNAGSADGRIGERTREAIRNFERARGMPVRGRATDVVLEAARAEAG
jgi:hypothetical protein